jgi:hypothetical protein
MMSFLYTSPSCQVLHSRILLCLLALKKQVAASMVVLGKLILLEIWVTLEKGSFPGLAFLSESSPLTH